LRAARPAEASQLTPGKDEHVINAQYLQTIEHKQDACEGCGAPIAQTGLIIVSGPRRPRALCQPCFRHTISPAGVHEQAEDAVILTFFCLFLGLVFVGVLLAMALA